MRFVVNNFSVSVNLWVCLYLLCPPPHSKTTDIIIITNGTICVYPTHMFHIITCACSALNALMISRFHDINNSWNQTHPKYLHYNNLQNWIMMGYAAWRSGFHVWLVMWRSCVRTPSKAPVVSLSKKLYPYCLVLVGSRNAYEQDFTIELKQIEGLMEDNRT